MDDIRPTDASGDEAEHPADPGRAPESNGGAAGPSAEDLRKRLDDAERELAKARAERDEYKASMYSLLGQLIPYEPMTEEEAYELMHAPRGQPIIEIIEELERKMEAGH